MDRIRNGWFEEVSELWPGQKLCLQVDEVSYYEKSKYQEILVFQSKHHGPVLVLDGAIQCTEKDEFAYQEMISFLPLCIHPAPKNVLIVGGGDGGVAREVAKHPLVERIIQVEIDDKVIDASKKYLPYMSVGFSSPKLTLKVCDGFEFMKNHKNEFDVIITDSSDPVGPAINLFTESYFSLLKNALKSDGIICSQGGTAWTDLHIVKSTVEHCRKHFTNVEYAYCSVPTYPDGQIGFVIGSLNENLDMRKPQTVFTDDEVDRLNLRYYNSDIHQAAFVLPNFVKKAIKKS